MYIRIHVRRRKRYTQRETISRRNARERRPRHAVYTHREGERAQFPLVARQARPTTSVRKRDSSTTERTERSDASRHWPSEWPTTRRYPTERPTATTRVPSRSPLHSGPSPSALPRPTAPIPSACRAQPPRAFGAIYTLRSTLPSPHVHTAHSRDTHTHERMHIRTHTRARARAGAERTHVCNTCARRTYTCLLLLLLLRHLLLPHLPSALKAVRVLRYEIQRDFSSTTIAHGAGYVIDRKTPILEWNKTHGLIATF